MHINHFTQAVKQITERSEQLGLPKDTPIELMIILTNGNSLVGTIETFDMNGLVVVKSVHGITVYLSVDAVVMISRSV